MIVAGIGSRKGVAADEIVALIDRALAQVELDRAALGAVATIEAKSGEHGIALAAQALSVPFRAIPQEQVQAAHGGVTWSAQSVRLFDVASVSEAAALAAAGEGSKLILPRITSPMATCALAQSLPHEGRT